jgi:hypothetical protein
VLFDAIFQNVSCCRTKNSPEPLGSHCQARSAIGSRRGRYSLKIFAVVMGLLVGLLILYISRVASRQDNLR